MNRVWLCVVALLAATVLPSKQALAEAPPAYLFSWSTAPVPTGIAVAAAGVYVASQGDKVQLFTKLGAPITEWGSRGPGDGQFYFPNGVAADADGNVYVTDRGNHRVQKFTSAGSYVAQWGTEGTGDGQFQEPLGIAVGPDGNVYVTDGRSVQKFSTAGAFLSRIGTPGQDPGQLSNPTAVAFDVDGNVYVADAGNQRIVKFSSAGDFLTQWGSLGQEEGAFASPQGIAVDVDSVYVADYYNDRIQKFTRAGAFVAQWGSEGNGPGHFTRPSGIAIGDSGHVYVTDAYNGRVQVFGHHAIATLRVPADYPSIQAAILATGAGDTVLVARGTYDENLDFHGKSLVLASEFVHDADPATIAATVIDGGGRWSVLDFHTEEDTSAAVIGLTIRNGKGGIACDQNTSPRLEHLVVRDNVGDYYGGGIIAGFARPLLYDCTITGNSAPNGAGIWGGGVIGAPDRRCNVHNNAIRSSVISGNPCAIGADLLNAPGTVYLDTFTVIHPDESLVYPVPGAGTNLDILHGYYAPITAPDVYVSPSGDNANDGLSPATPLRNVWLTVLRIAGSPATPVQVHLGPGTYSPSLSGERPIYGRSYASLIGADSATTVIDGEGSNCLLSCTDVIGFALSGITFRYGVGYEGALHFRRSSAAITQCGIGPKAHIQCDEHSTLSVTGCTIGTWENTAILFKESGGRVEGSLIEGSNVGIGVSGGDVAIVGNSIVGNYYGIDMSNSNGEIRHNRIERSGYRGIVCSGLAPTIVGNEIVDNLCPGIVCSADAVIDSNLIARNHVTTFEAGGAGITINGGHPTITRNRFLGNEALGSPEFSDQRSRGGAIYIDGAAPVIGGSPANGNLFRDNRALTGADLFATHTVGTINAQGNSFRVYPVTGYYAAPLEAFDVSNGTGDLTPITQNVYVAPAGDDGSAGTSATTPLKTIQAALSRLLPAPGQPLTIHVADGVYAPDGNGDSFPLVLTSNVSLRGNGPDRSILDARSTGGVIRVDGASNVTISGLTIRGGQNGSGGGVNFRAAMGCSLVSNVITGNAGFLGGGISCQEGSNPVIVANLVTGNQTRDTRFFARVGGGLFAQGAQPILIHNVIAGNTALDYGGGVACWNDANTLVLNNTIVGNTAAGSSGGLSSVNSNVTIVNSIVRDNTAPTGSQLDGYNLAVSYSDIAGGWTGEGNIDADPLFNAATGRYNLTAGSPCVDAGNPAPEFADPEDPARAGLALLPALGTVRNDMGAFGGPGPTLALPARILGPDCSAAAASVPVITKHHGLQLESIVGVTDPGGGPVTIRITGVTQDEPIIGRGGRENDPDEDDDGDHHDGDGDGDGDGDHHDGDGHDDSVVVPGITAVGPSRASAGRDEGGGSGVQGHGDGERDCPDAFIIDNGQFNLRRERTKHGNGRVYAISFTATNAAGGECSDTVRVCVPASHDARTCVDDGQTVNSLGPCLRRSASPQRASVDALELAPRTSTGSQVTLEFALPDESDVLIGVFDVSGRRLATLENSRRPAGWHTVSWSTSGVSSGMYFVRLRAGSQAVTKAVQVLK